MSVCDETEMHKSFSEQYTKKALQTKAGHNKKYSLPIQSKAIPDWTKQFKVRQGKIATIVSGLVSFIVARFQVGQIVADLEPSDWNNRSNSQCTR